MYASKVSGFDLANDDIVLLRTLNSAEDIRLYMMKHALPCDADKQVQHRTFAAAVAKILHVSAYAPLLIR